MEVSERTIVVLGMHRAGTSMVAGVLDKLGVDMGNEMIGRSDSNPLGHYENLDFFELNREMLERAGGKWDDPPSEEALAQVGNEMEDHVQELVDEKNEKDVWGWKDPRTSLTIGNYLPHLNNPYFIICRRDEDEIAESLEERDGMKHEEAVKLARVYYDRIESFLEENQLPHLNVHYTDAVEDSRSFVENIDDFLGMETSEETLDEAADFIRTPDEMYVWKRLYSPVQIIKSFLGSQRKKFREKFDN